VRKAESRLLPARLKTTLEASGPVGAVRVVPEGVKFVDVMVSGKILESTGGRLELEIDAVDATGRGVDPRQDLLGRSRPRLLQDRCRDACA
jgi:hypothetical protein